MESPASTVQSVECIDPGTEAPLAGSTSEVLTRRRSRHVMQDCCSESGQTNTHICKDI